MGKIIRRTLTITLTETWTIAWGTDDNPLHHLYTIVDYQAKTAAEPNEALQVTRPDAESGKPSPGNPRPAQGSAIGPELQPDASAKRVRRRRKATRTRQSD